jgi:GAF domain-containing protein
MPAAPLPDDEEERLQVLEAYDILDTAPERTYDDLVRLASHLTGAPTSLITLVDEDRQWFKARQAFEVEETHRDVSFCAHLLDQPHEPLIVEDATEDPRFAENPLVQTKPQIRFYAGVPLVTPEEHVLGSLCVIDYQPREVSNEERRMLKALGRQAMTNLEKRRREHELEQRVDELEARLDRAPD